MHQKQGGHRGRGGRGGRGSGRGWGGGRGGGGGGFGRGGGKRNFHSRDNNKDNFRGPMVPRSMNCLKETDVGMTEYIGSSVPPFNGIIKSKFSDFLVNEIDMDGNVVALTDLSIPLPPVSEETKALMKDIDPDLKGLVTEEQWQTIRDIVDTRDRDGKCMIDCTSISKDDRTKIHIIIKQKYERLVISKTVDEGEKKFIVVSLWLHGGGKPDIRTKWTFPHEYTYFVVHKCNMDTMKACSELAKTMRMNAANITYAGTKDKRANTSQWFCIRKKLPHDIASAGRKISGLTVGNFTFKPETLKLGNLKGNRFQIALRQISVDQSAVEASLKVVQEQGFINYYGLQRFGNSAEVPTFAIGRALLQGKWMEAVELIMKPREGDLPFMDKMRRFWMETRDASEARKMLHFNNHSNEAKLLEGLAKHNENDIVNALSMIPRNVRLLYMHAYQSLVWNKVASKRIQMGISPIVGDLVMVDKGTKGLEQIHAEEEEEQEPVVEEAENVEKPEGQTEDQSEDTSAVEQKVDYKALVRALTQEDIDSGNFMLSDVVLPLPGHDIAYPENEIGQYYVELLAQDDLSSEKLKQKSKEYSLTGAYRKLIETVADMKWSFVKYNSNDDMLQNTDYNLMDQKRLVKLPEDGAFTACLLEFSLNSSTYATMALREILKVDTSTQNQIKLAKEMLEATQKKNEEASSEQVDQMVTEEVQGEEKKKEVEEEVKEKEEEDGEPTEKRQKTE